MQAQLRKEAGEVDSEDDEDSLQMQQRAQAAASVTTGGRSGRKSGDMFAFSLRTHFKSMSSVYALAWCGDVLITASSTQVRRGK